MIRILLAAAATAMVPIDDVGRRSRQALLIHRCHAVHRGKGAVASHALCADCVVDAGLTVGCHACWRLHHAAAVAAAAAAAGAPAVDVRAGS